MSSTAGRVINRSAVMLLMVRRSLSVLMTWFLNQRLGQPGIPGETQKVRATLSNHAEELCLEAERGVVRRAAFICQIP